MTTSQKSLWKKSKTKKGWNRFTHHHYVAGLAGVPSAEERR